MPGAPSPTILVVDDDEGMLHLIASALQREKWTVATAISGAAGLEWLRRNSPGLLLLDLDNFKVVNDLFGHQVGDAVLRSIVDELKAQLRKTDIVARVGGDEFALLLPSTIQPEAEIVLSKVHANLSEAMKRSAWPVTFSMGAVTCVRPPYAAEQLINLADELMYAVKNSTKNDVRFITWGGEKSYRYQPSA